jgi:hypothetical protein
MQMSEMTICIKSRRSQSAANRLLTEEEIEDGFKMQMGVFSS